MSNNKIPLMSEKSTSGGTKRTDSDGYSWTNYEGTKDSHNIEATQFNSKDYDGEHRYYNPKTGHQGVKGANSPRKHG